MELRHLEAFVAVAEELHFSRAAERLRVAQSPLSQRIKTLEGELGVRLFERTNRRVALTDAGARILREARATLRAAEATRRAAQRAREGETGLLRLGFVASAAFLHLPELLRALGARTPDLEIELLRLNSAAQLDALFEDHIDVGIARTPPERRPEIQTLDLGPEPLLAVVPANHPLAGERTLRLAELAGDPWVLSRPLAGSDLTRQIHRACARAGFMPRVAHEVRDLPSVMGPVAGGLGVSLVPLGIARLHVPGAATVPLDAADRAALPATLMWHADRTTAIVQRLITAARSTASSRHLHGRAV